MEKQKKENQQDEQQEYEVHYNELKTIVQDIENGEISVDVLSQKVKRAKYLIEFCKNKLKDTEKDVEDILKEME